MKEPVFILSIGAMVATGLVLLVMLVFCLAMGANASSAEIRSLKLWMLGLSAMTLVGIAVGIVLLRFGQLEWSASVSIFPAVVMGVIALAALMK